jgi:hypothetical protein
VEALFKSSTSPKWARYEIYGLDRGVVYVNLDKGTARVMDDKSRCAKEWAKRQARTARIAEAKIAKAAKHSGAELFSAKLDFAKGSRQAARS